MSRSSIAIRVSLAALIALVSVLQWSIGYEISKAAFFREGPKSPCRIFVDGVFPVTPPPPSAALHFDSSPVYETGYQYSGDVAFAYSSVNDTGYNDYNKVVLVVHNTSTEPLTLRKTDFAFADGFGSSPRILWEDAPWHDFVPPGATVRNEITLTSTSSMSKKINNAASVRWTIRGDLGTITVPIYDPSKQYIQKPFGFGIC